MMVYPHWFQLTFLCVSAVFFNKLSLAVASAKVHNIDDMIGVSFNTR